MVTSLSNDNTIIHHNAICVSYLFSFILEIADQLGHESVKTTLDTYSHLYPDKDQQLADRLDQFRLADPEGKETP